MELGLGLFLFGLLARLGLCLLDGFIIGTSTSRSRQMPTVALYAATGSLFARHRTELSREEMIFVVLLEGCSTGIQIRNRFRESRQKPIPEPLGYTLEIGAETGKWGLDGRNRGESCRGASVPQESKLARVYLDGGPQTSTGGLVRRSRSREQHTDACRAKLP